MIRYDYQDFELQSNSNHCPSACGWQLLNLDDVSQMTNPLDYGMYLGQGVFEC